MPSPAFSHPLRSNKKNGICEQLPHAKKTKTKNKQTNKWTAERAFRAHQQYQRNKLSESLEETCLRLSCSPSLSSSQQPGSLSPPHCLSPSLSPTERNPSYKLHRRDDVPTAATWLWLATCRHPAATAGTVRGQADEFKAHKSTEVNFKVIKCAFWRQRGSWEMSRHGGWNNNVMVRCSGSVIESRVNLVSVSVKVVSDMWKYPQPQLTTNEGCT